ncbi:MAG: DUF1963 domain-containing protein, partial [Oricola sp.]
MDDFPSGDEPARPDIERWQKRLLSGNVDPRVADIWSGCARHGIRIELGAPLPVEHSLEASKFCSIPDWRSPLRDAASDGYELTLLAQINLADISGMETGLDLPKTGLLQFFYDVAKQPWGLYRA